VLQENIWKEFD